MFLLGNKNDERGPDHIETPNIEDVQDWCSRDGIIYYSCSANRNSVIMEDMIFPLDLFFDRVVREMHIKKFGMRREGFIDGPTYSNEYAARTCTHIARKRRRGARGGGGARGEGH